MSLKNRVHLKRRKLQQKLWLKQEHELCRLQFAEKHVYTNKKWRTVVFTDEKKFNLKKPDGFHYSYRDLRKDILKRLTNKLTRERHELPKVSLQRDNAKAVKQYLAHQGIHSAKSPDLNVIENFWASLTTEFHVPEWKIIRKY
ncbi:unnamed protein product [Heterotrigona itama]|uniref:Tc1-like transposase DDE domain-containing protein n=1 Tax=Heterotrigona itama TaxID=395501 RepID=A0A6V7GXK5_9HYME|nr:unnamed protein product [Heterotrigona itama]